MRHAILNGPRADGAAPWLPCRCSDLGRCDARPECRRPAKTRRIAGDGLRWPAICRCHLARFRAGRATFTAIRIEPWGIPATGASSRNRPDQCATCRRRTPAPLPARPIEPALPARRAAFGLHSRECCAPTGWRTALSPLPIHHGTGVRGPRRAGPAVPTVPDPRHSEPHKVTSPGAANRGAGRNQCLKGGHRHWPA